MTIVQPRLGRRALSAMLIAAPVGMATATPRSPVMVDAATLLVAGPEGSGLDRWGRAIHAALSHTLPPDTALTLGNAGGPDGVTGANQFATRAEPDGRTILLAPPDAVIAWLIGDPRAKFDLGRWTTVMTAITPLVLLIRPGIDLKKKPVRIAVPTLASTALPGIMALDLMGGRAEPVIGIGVEAQEAAYAAGSTDAVLARGGRVQDQVHALTQAGARPVMTFVSHLPGTPSRDPAFPDIPSSAALVGSPSPLIEALAALATAARLEFALALPQLTPVARLAVWLQAAGEAAQVMDLQSMATALGARTIGGVAAVAEARQAVASQPALQALRGWLADRFKFKPV